MLPSVEDVGSMRPARPGTAGNGTPGCRRRGCPAAGRGMRDGAWPPYGRPADADAYGRVGLRKRSRRYSTPNSGSRNEYQVSGAGTSPGTMFAVKLDSFCTSMPETLTERSPAFTQPNSLRALSSTPASPER